MKSTQFFIAALLCCLFTSFSSKAQYNCSAYQSSSFRYHNDTTFADFTVDPDRYTSSWTHTGTYFSSTAVYRWVFSDSSVQTGQNVTFAFTRNRELYPDFSYTVTVTDTATASSGIANNDLSYPEVFNCSFFGTSVVNNITPWYCGEVDIWLNTDTLYPIYRSVFNFTASFNWGDGDSSVISGTAGYMSLMENHRYLYRGVYKLKTSITAMNPDDSTTCPTIYSPLEAKLVDGSTPPAVISGTFTVCEGDTLFLTATDTTSLFHNLWHSTDLTGTSGHIDTLAYPYFDFYWNSSTSDRYYEGPHGDSMLVFPDISPSDTVFSFNFYSAPCVAPAAINVSISVLRTTLPPISGTRYMCSGTSYTFTDSATGGIWSSNNAAVATVNPTTGIVTATGAGTTLIKYHLGTGCPAIFRITVDMPSIPSIEGLASVAPGQTVALTDSFAGGSWSSSNPSIATIDASGNVLGVSNGEATITYTYSIGCTSYYSYMNMYVSNAAITTYAGSFPGGTFSGDGGGAISAGFASTVSVCFDDSANLIISDYTGQRIRRVDRLGVISTIAGTGTGGYSGDGGAAMSAAIRFAHPVSDRHGNILFCDQGNNVVRKISSAGIITTIAGNGYGAGGPATYLHAPGAYTGDGGPATAAALNEPQGLTMDAAGNLYIADAYNHVIRKVNTSGIITTYAGTGYDSGRYSSYFRRPLGDGGPATDADLNAPSCLISDTAGNLYFIERNRGLVRKINTSGVISTVAGIFPSGTYPYNKEGYPATATHMSPTAITFDNSGNLIIASGSSCIYKVNSAGILNRIAGSSYNPGVESYYAGLPGYLGDGGAALLSKLKAPSGLAIDAANNIYIADNENNVIRKIGSPTSITHPTVTDTNISRVTITDFNDSIVTAPCDYPANVRVRVKGGAAGHPSIYDSIYIRLYYGDGTNDVQVVSIDTTDSFNVSGTTYFSYNYTTYHSYATPGTYYTSAEAVVNTGTHSSSEASAYHPVFPFLRLDDCASAGSIVSSVTRLDTSSTICHTPYTTSFSISGIFRGAADTIAGVSYYINYGDGTEDTIELSRITDGYGHYYCYDTLSHTYSLPGIYSPVIKNIDSSRNLLHSSFTLGTTCSNVSGVLYKDVNSNCTADAGEQRFSYWPIAVVNNTLNDTSFVWCDSAGRYSITLVDSVSYSILPDYFLAFGYDSGSIYLSCPGTSVFTITTVAGVTYSQDFGFNCRTHTSLDMTVAGFGNRFVPGRTTSIRVWSSDAWGYMCDYQTATISLTYDTILTYVGMSSGPAPTSISGNTLTWSFNSGHGILDFNGIINVTCHTTATISDTVKNTVHVMPTSVGELDSTDNTYVWKTRVTTSYDPNEKEVSPKGYGAEGFIADGTPLNYMIHFQNTGTDTAYDITVVDTLSRDLDIATLQLTGSSHNVIIVHEPATNIVKFRFNDIRLPDSATNLIASNGYVSFNIVPRSGLIANTQIRNGSAIYFDYNPAVLTNSTINTIMDTLRAIAGPSTVCVGSTITLTNALAGGTWHSSNSHATVSAAGIVTGVSSGIDTISYTVYGDQTVSRIIIIGSGSSAGTLSGTTTICTGTTTTFSSTITGGTWSTSAASTASISSTGVVIGVTAGSATITYSITNSCGTDVTTAAVTINPLPSAGTLSGTTSVCAGATTTLSSSITGGTWSTSVASIASVSSTGVVSGVTAGSATISYSITNSCGTDVTTTAVTINPPPSAGTLSGTTSVCAGATTTLSSSITGGTWSTSAASTASVSSTGVVTGVAAGSATLSYSITNSCGTDVSTASITVNPLPSAGTLSGTTTVCAGATTTLSSSITGGTWSTSAASIASVSSTGVVTGVAAGSATISYSVTNSCGTDVATASVTVNPLPVAGTIIGSDSVCVGSSITLSSPGTVATSSTWYCTTATIVNSDSVITGISSGGGLCILYVTNSCGSDTSSKVLTVMPLPDPGTLTGADSVCAGASITLTTTVTGGTWSISGSSATVAAGVVTGVAAGTATVTYSVANYCGTGTRVHSVITNPLPVAGTISGSSTVCESATTTLASTIAGGAWSSSATSIASVDAATGIVAGITAGSATISYIVANSCGSDLAPYSVTVNPLPAAGTISGADSVCVGDTILLTDTVMSGVWSSSDMSIASVTTSGNVIGVATGSAIVTYTVTNSCGTAATNHPVFVKSIADCYTDVKNLTGNAVTISVYPNPTTGSFVIDIPIGATNVLITVTDVTGKTITEMQPKNPSGLKVPVDLQNVARGTYLLKINMDSKLYHDKIIVW